MAVRFKRKKCSNCPVPAVPTAPPPPRLKLGITSDGEGVRLWNHVLFGTGTCILMMEGYADLDMPGDPLAGMQALRDRLTAIINRYEAKPK